MPTLTATLREKVGKTTVALTKEGKLPAVVYGPKMPATSITLDGAEFAKILRDEGESVVIDLVGLASPVQVLIHDIDMDPVKHTPRHADFYAIEKGAKVEVSVPLSFIGESFAVKTGANLVKVLHEVEIEAGAADIPQEIEVDISALKEVGDQIHASDLKLPKGVTLVTDAEEVVALAQSVEVEEESDSAGVDMSAIAVEKKGKEEEPS
jgi:large subunit ribosomal protein L25